MMNQMACGVSVLCQHLQMQGADYGTDAVLSSEMVVGFVHRIVGQTDL